MINKITKIFNLDIKERKITMKEEKFGTIMNDGKIIDLDKENIEKLEKLSADLKDKSNSLKQKAEAIFNQ
jgi:hypothetical protein